jgi:hypothetical protein
LLIPFGIDIADIGPPPDGLLIQVLHLIHRDAALVRSLLGMIPQPFVGVVVIARIFRGLEKILFGHSYLPRIPAKSGPEHPWTLRSGMPFPL